MSCPVGSQWPKMALETSRNPLKTSEIFGIWATTIIIHYPIQMLWASDHACLSWIILTLYIYEGEKSLYQIMVSGAKVVPPTCLVEKCVHKTVKYM